MRACGVYFNFTFAGYNGALPTCMGAPASCSVVSFNSGPYNSQQFTNWSPDAGALLYHLGEVADCGSRGCSTGFESTNLELGTFAKLVAPELSASGVASALALLLSSLAILGARRPRTRIV